MIKKIVIILIGVFIFSSIGAIIVYGVTEDIDFNESIQIDEVKKQAIDGINQININAVSANVNFIFVEDNEITVKYYGNIKCFLCHIDYELESTKLNNQIDFSASNKRFGIFLHNNIYIDVYLPQTYENNLNVNVVSSDIKIDEEMNLDYLNIDTVSGDIDVKNLSLNKARFNTTSGEMILSHLNVEQDTYLYTISGDVELKTITSSNIHFNSVSGEIYGEDINGNVSGSSISGDITIYENSPEFNINLSSTSGEIIIDLDEESKFNFTIQTISGHISIEKEYTVSSAPSKNNITGRIGESTNNIQINTVSGNIKI